MFFLHELERTTNLHPSYFGPNSHEYVWRELLRDVEGRTMGNYVIVAVLDTYEISEGRITPGKGWAEYTIHYKAVVWKPYRGEILDGLVSSVLETGFFVDIGPLNVFVSQEMIPSEIKYDPNATPAQWTDNADQVIEKGTHVRVKLKGIRAEVDQLYAIATIKEDYLGPLSGDTTY